MISWSDNMVMPISDPELAPAPRQWMNYVYDPVNMARITAYVQYIPPVEGTGEALAELPTAPSSAENPLINPPDDVPRRRGRLAGPHRRGGPGVLRRCTPTWPGPERPTAWPGPPAAGTRRKITPYLLSLPALAYLAVFFVVPLWALLAHVAVHAARARSSTRRSTFNWEFGNYSDAFSRYDDQILPVVPVRAGAPRCWPWCSAYPLAYVLAFKAGKWKNAAARPGDPAVLHHLHHPHPGLEDDLRRRQRSSSGILDTVGPAPSQRADPVHPVGGDRRAHLQLPAVHDPADLREHREDRPPPARGGPRPLRRRRAARSARCSCRCRCPACFAGSLLTFIPAAGDFVNAQYLGGTNQAMVGTVDPEPVPGGQGLPARRRRCRSC